MNLQRINCKKTIAALEEKLMRSKRESLDWEVLYQETCKEIGQLEDKVADLEMMLEGRDEHISILEVYKARIVLDEGGWSDHDYAWAVDVVNRTVEDIVTDE